MNRMNGTRFMTQEELAKQLQEIDLSNEQYTTGGVPLLVQGDKAYVDGSDSHTIIFGATGSKKTRMFAMPSIGIFSRAGESFVVSDPKGELYERTAGDVAQRGYKVVCLNLRNMRAGATWNPLRLPYEYYHRGKKTKAVELITEFATMLIGKDASEEQFWVQTSVDIVTAFVLLLFENCSKPECNLKSLMNLWAEYTNEGKKFIRSIKKRYKDHIIGQKLSLLDNNSDKTVGSMEAVVNMGFNKLVINEEFVAFLSQEGINLGELTDGKTAIYLVIPDENKTYHFVVSLFLEQLYEELIRAAQDNQDCKLKNRMNFLIDEFANIPKLENMEAMITAARSRNIRFHLIIQSIKQLRQKYDDIADVICSNCNNWIYLYSKEYQLLKEISLLCGEVIYDNNMRMPLFSEFDLQHLSKERGEALVLAGRNYPCLSTLTDIDEYPYRHKQCSAGDAQKWYPVPVYDYNFKNVDAYRYPMGYNSLWYAEREYEKEPERWLVAVGPEGVIMAESMVAEDRIEDGSAMWEMGKMLEDKWRINLKKLHWYSADKDTYWKYLEILHNEPELVYATLDEVGKHCFRREEFAHSKAVEFEEDKEKYYLFEATKGSRGNYEELKSLKVKYFKGNIGERYAQMQLFRFANVLLKGTEFETVPWGQEFDNWIGMEYPEFVKEGSARQEVKVIYKVVRKE